MWKLTPSGLAVGSEPVIFPGDNFAKRYAFAASIDLANNNNTNSGGLVQLPPKEKKKKSNKVHGHSGLWPCGNRVYSIGNGRFVEALGISLLSFGMWGSW